LTKKDSLISFFDNRTWSNHGIVADFDNDDHLAAWKHPQANVFIILSVFIIMKVNRHTDTQFCPQTIDDKGNAYVCVSGAAFGRLVGEGLATLFPDGFNVDGHIYHIVPGAYAVIGAAALAAGVTHTISTGVIMMELTGQINYTLPILISVILANMVSQSLQPSIYDTAIRIKKLPYLPMLSWGHREKYNIYVEDFMKRDVRYITLNSTYRDIIKILRSGNLKTLPLVKSAESMLLLGSVGRVQLLGLLTQRMQHLREDNASTMPVRYKVRFQTSTEESASASTAKPLKSALKKPPVDEEEITSVYDSGLNLKKFFCSRPEIKAMELWFSLRQTHTMFSVLNLDYAYVTSIGRLVGAVSLKEVGINQSHKNDIQELQIKLFPHHLHYLMLIYWYYASVKNLEHHRKVSL
ncbi:hypothetical protein cypCar_00041800, partial [Cyprinus carpio]